MQWLLHKLSHLTKQMRYMKKKALIVPISSYV